MREVVVLYVGGDRSLVDFVQQIERYCGGGWRGETAAAGKEAIEACIGAQYDLVIAESSLVNPSVHELMGYLRENQPAALRYVVVDTADKSSMLRFFAEAHQVIARPVQTSALARQLQNALNLQGIFTNPQVKSRIGAIKSLPCLPQTYSRLTAELRSENSSARRVAELISVDAAITAKLLQVVNSAYFGMSRRITDVFHAVNLVGMSTVQSLVLSAGVFEQFQGVSFPQSSMDEIYQDSISVGARSRLLAHSFGLHPGAVEEALLGGMLHDIGRLLMAKCFADELKRAVEAAKERGLTLIAAEEQILGVSDSVIGAYLLSLWGLAHPVVEAVALHYRPRQCPAPVLGPLTTVHLAWAITHDEKRRIRSDRESSVDMDYLATLGIHGQLPALRAFCAGAVARA
ncbi:MAG: HDOD domain-containing protein [Candidatus Zixiibacteriota bacterium]